MLTLKEQGPGHSHERFLTTVCPLTVFPKFEGGNLRNSSSSLPAWAYDLAGRAKYVYDLEAVAMLCLLFFYFILYLLLRYTPLNDTACALTP
ncbi:hypothetical protein BJY04DRAFT_168702 [Aspergillus karnatakaensis]|uniref:uncharacterized protein n=1 Tax=Aspergillus karnatakaensis TaxID=1810916 RepID=UPI003CCCDB51